LLLFDFSKSIAGIHLRTEEHSVSLFQFSDGLLRKTFALQTQRVNAINFGLIAFPDCLDKWECVARDDRKTAYKGMWADSAELMNSRKSTHGRVISNSDVPGEGGGVGHNNAVSHAAIVSHMAIGHEKIIASDNSHAMPSPGAAVKGYEFTEDIIFSDLQACGFSSVLEILWICSNGTVAVKMATAADCGPSMDIDMGIQSDAICDYGLRSNDTVGANIG
jgi:hypothetical protein